MTDKEEDTQRGRKRKKDRRSGRIRQKWLLKEDTEEEYVEEGERRGSRKVKEDITW